MNRGIYTAASGMSNIQQWMDSVTNNLANASTNGFKRESLAFSQTMEQQMYANSGTGPAIGALGAGASQVGDYTIFEAGPLTNTGHDLDVALNDPKAMLAVQTPGGVRYTRDGALKVDDQGQLVNTSGLPILDDRQNPISVGNNGKVTIGANGDVLAGDKKIATLGIFEGSFAKEGSNLYIGTGTPIANASVTPGTLEGSNVNSIQSMVELIQLNRMFELSQKTIQNQDDLTGKLITVLQ